MWGRQPFQLIESVHDNFEGQLDRELRSARSLMGVMTRVAERLLTCRRPLSQPRPPAGP